MNREQAIKHYKENVAKMLVNEYENKFNENFIKQEKKAKKIIIDSMKSIINKVISQKDDNNDYKLSVFQFELLRINIIDESYKIYIHGYSSLWYLDDNSVYEYIDLKFLFEPFVELKQKLLEARKKYLGKINIYDIQAIIFEIAVKVFNELSGVVREWLWDLDEEEWIKNPIIDDFYIVKWSEYLGQSETVFAMDNKQKSITDLLELKKKSKEKNIYIYTVWKNCDFQEAEFKEENMLFINFKGSSLKKINFINTNMVRAQFKNTSIKECKFEEAILISSSFEGAKINDCDFVGSDLREVDFKDSIISNSSFKDANLQNSYFVWAKFNNVSFAGANLEGAIFKAEDIPFLHLTSEQLQTIFIEGEQA